MSQSLWDNGLAMRNIRELRSREYHRIIDQRKSKDKNRFVKGTALEDHVAELFPNETFSILHDTRKVVLDGTMKSRLKDPDFQLQHKESGDKFWVECKYRSSARYGVIGWCKDPHQFERYKAFQEKVRPQRVYAIIGLIGSSAEPKFMYCIPLDDIKKADLYVNEIVQYKRNPCDNFRYIEGRLC
jgi:hypothetical protein